MAIRKIISRSIGVDVIAAEDLAAGSVQTAEIQNAAVTGAKLAANLNYDSGTLYLDSTNNRVGMGTTTPSKPLHVKGDVDVEGVTGGVAVLRFKAEEIHGTVEGVNIGTNYGGLAFKTNNNGTVAEKIRIDNAGNVGIGIVSPEARLDILGNSDSVAALKIGPNANFGHHIYDSSTNGDLVIKREESGTQSETMRLTRSGGFVGIGTSSPDTTMHIHTSSAGTVDAVSGGVLTLEKNNHAVLQFLTPNNKKAIIYFGDPDDIDVGRLEYDHSSNAMSFNVNAVQRMKIDSAGNVGIAATPETTFAQKTTLRLNATASLIAGGAYYPYPYYIANNLYYDSSDNLKYIASSGGALLDVNAHLGGKFTFYTAPAGTAGATASLTERMRLTTDGNLLVGCSSLPSASVFGLGINASNNSELMCSVAGTGNSTQVRFLNPNGEVGAIRTNGTATSYLTSSDYRLKENVEYDFDASTRLKQLKPARFNFIADADTTVDGFLAHEVQDIIPEAISGTHDEVDDDGNPVYQGIDQAKLVPLLVKSLQEALTEIDSLKARLDDAGL